MAENESKIKKLHGEPDSSNAMLYVAAECFDFSKDLITFCRAAGGLTEGGKNTPRTRLLSQYWKRHEIEKTEVLQLCKDGHYWVSGKLIMKNLRDGCKRKGQVLPKAIIAIKDHVKSKYREVGGKFDIKTDLGWESYKAVTERFEKASSIELGNLPEALLEENPAIESLAFWVKNQPPEIIANLLDVFTLSIASCPDYRIDIRYVEPGRERGPCLDEDEFFEDDATKSLIIGEHVLMQPGIIANLPDAFTQAINYRNQCTPRVVPRLRAGLETEQTIQKSTVLDEPLYYEAEYYSLEPELYKGQPKQEPQFFDSGSFFTGPAEVHKEQETERRTQRNRSNTIRIPKMSRAVRWTLVAVCCLVIGGGFAVARVGFSNILTMGETIGWDEAAKAVFSSDLTNQKTRCDSVHILYRASQYSDALKLNTSLLLAESKLIRAKAEYNQGAIQIKRGLLAEAKWAMERSKTLYYEIGEPVKAERVITELADIERMLGDIGEAQRLLAIVTDITDASYLRVLGNILFDLGDYQGAIEVMTKRAQSGKRSIKGNSYSFIGLCHIMMGNISEALWFTGEATIFLDGYNKALRYNEANWHFAALLQGRPTSEARLLDWAYANEEPRLIEHLEKIKGLLNLD